MILALRVAGFGLIVKLSIPLILSFKIFEGFQVRVGMPEHAPASPLSLRVLAGGQR
jgi:hypothetical protein